MAGSKIVPTYRDFVPVVANAIRSLAEAVKVDEVKEIRDKALALAVYAQQAKDRALEINAAEIRARAERRAGVMLDVSVNLERGRPPVNGNAGLPLRNENSLDNGNPELPLSEGGRTFLADLGISKKESSDWQKIAKMAEDEFEDALSTARTTGKPIKTADLIRTEQKADYKAKLEDIETKRIKELVGVYDVIVMDPPWPIQKIERDVRPNQVMFDYPTMSIEEIAEQVGEKLRLHCASDCHIFVWTTQKFLPDSFDLLRKWDVSYVFTMAWHKPGGFQPIGLAQYNGEFVIYGRKGAPQFVDTKDFPVIFSAPRTVHTEKPDSFYDTIRRVTAGRRLDMYNRRVIEGFDGWGLEAK
jgi:N6-adenosine-specific RNA methylase IME4